MPGAVGNRIPSRTGGCLPVLTQERVSPAIGNTLFSPFSFSFCQTRPEPSCPAYEQPVVVPQSSHTLQVPFCFTRIDPQFSHCSPVKP